MIDDKDFQLYFINYITIMIFVLFTYQFINIIFKILSTIYLLKTCNL